MLYKKKIVLLHNLNSTNKHKKMDLKSVVTIKCDQGAIRAVRFNGNVYLETFNILLYLFCQLSFYFMYSGW